MEITILEIIFQLFLYYARRIFLIKIATYYSQNYAGILGSGLMKDKRNHHGAVGKSSSEQHFRKSGTITFIV